MKQKILETISNLIPTLTEPKFLYCMINGGWEKCFENEFAFKLWEILGYQKYKVYMQYKRFDIKIKNISTDQCKFIELGHYTLNQKLQTRENFKPYIDIMKRENQGNTNIFHIMLFEGIKADKGLYLKYPKKFINEIEYYLKLYNDYNLYHKVFKLKNMEFFGYKIDSYIILSHKKKNIIKKPKKLFNKK